MKPVQLKPYHAPFALQSKIQNEIQRLIDRGNLEPVACSKWATPIIPVLKKDGRVRLCGNFKVTVNPQLVIKRHPIPIKEKIFKTLQVGKSWSQIDLTHAFMQFELDERSRDALTIITENGLYRYTKLPEGVASSPAECQEILEGVLKGIPHTEVYIDNIYCTGKDDNEHIKILNEIFTRLDKAGFRLNILKCEFFKKQIEILGFLIDESGLKPNPSKVKAVKEAPVPQNHKELKAFLGLLNFYEKFLPDRAEHVKPLYDLCNKKSYEWTENCQRAYQWLKDQITSDRVLTLYDPNKQLILACDASFHGLSAVLSHRFEDGTEQPIAFASKIIPKNELHRAILDKEAGAIVFGFRKFYQYVYGSKVILRTDHEALKFIFGENKNLSTMLQSRLQRWSYFLSGFTYDIDVIKSQANGNCDALSRLPIPDSTLVFESEFTNINFIEEGLRTVDFRYVAKETSKDKNLRNVINYLQYGWPKNIKDLNDVEKNLHGKRLELTIEKGCLLWGFRVVIPNSLQKYLLEELHASHMGIIKMKQLARNYFWWPNLNLDIENVASTCKICLESRPETPKIVLTPWQWPSNPWSRIHTDLLGPFHGSMFLLILDAHSKWPEIVNMGNNTKSDKLIRVFKVVFSRYGLPDHCESDNCPQYKNDFHEFLIRNGVKHTFSPPHCPATNGAAENFVKTFKTKVDKIVRDGKSLDNAISLFLLDYRSTPHCTTGRSPYFLMYKREMKTRFDLLKPNVVNEVENKQYSQIRNTGSRKNVNFDLDEIVFAKDYRKDSKGRKEALIIKKNSPVTYNVKFKDGFIAKKHVNQLIKTGLNKVQKKGENTDVQISGTNDKNHTVSNNVSSSNKAMFVPRRSPRLRNRAKT